MQGTTKGSSLAILNGYEFRQKGTNRAGTVQFWQCVDSTCNGRAHSPIGTTDLVLVTPHNNHLPPNNELRQAKEGIKTTAKENRRIPTRELISDAKAGSSAET